MTRAEDCEASIGKLIFYFQYLEHNYVKLLSTLSEVQSDYEFETIVDKLTFNDLLDAVGSIGKHKGISHQLEHRLKDVLNKSAKIAEERNRYVHSHYVLTKFDFKGDWEFARLNHKVSRRTGVKADIEAFDPAKVYKLCDDIHLIGSDLMTLHDDIKKKLFPDAEFVSEHERYTGRYEDRIRPFLKSKKSA